MLIWIVVALAVVLVLLAVVALNRLRIADERAQAALARIDVQLTRRATLVPLLVEAVARYAAHERGVLQEAAAAGDALTEATRSGSVAQRSAAERRLDRALGDVMAVAEAYPDLEATPSFERLRAELDDTGQTLSVARRDYDDAVRSLNSGVRTLPWRLLTGVAGVSERTPY